MKKNYFLIVVIAIVLSSCGHDSGRLIGSFQVISKEKSNPYNDYGFVTLISEKSDTIRVFSSEEEYLNIKTGDIYLVGKDRNNAFFLNNRIKKNIIGYGVVSSKEIKKGIPTCNIVTKGGDTISAQVAEIIYFNVSIGDSVFVKKNRDKNKPHYYVE